MGKSKKGKRGHYMKKVISIISIIVMVLSSFTVDVKADEKNDSQEYNPNGSGVVWSEDEVDGWNLEWISTSFFDTLISASNDEYFIEFEYDNDGKRILKNVNGECTTYEYDGYGRLATEKRENLYIVYNYENCDNNLGYYLKGFSVDGNDYEFRYVDGYIVGIDMDNEQLARYEYVGDICVSVQKKTEDGSWVEETDSDFIGNINRIRLSESYCDEETGWYYCGRYYSAELNRFIDGVSPRAAEKLKSTFPEYEVDIKTYTNGVGKFDTNCGIMRATDDGLTEAEVIRRVIMLESPTYELDENCVAWVIKNRMTCQNSDFKDVNTAYEVVTQEGQFSTYQSSSFYNFSEYASKSQWPYTGYLYYGLTHNSMVKKPSGFTEQLYFSSIKSFLEYTSASGGTFYNSVKKITYTNCWTVPEGDITAGNARKLDNTDYIGNYNVFCDKKFG